MTAVIGTNLLREIHSTAFAVSKLPSSSNEKKWNDIIELGSMGLGGPPGPGRDDDILIEYTHEDFRFVGVQRGRGLGGAEPPISYVNYNYCEVQRALIIVECRL